MRIFFVMMVKKCCLMFVKVLYFYQICKREGVQKVFGTLDLFVSLLETEIKYPILQGGILPFWTPSSYHHFCFCFSQVKIRSSWPRLWFFSSSKALEGTAGYSTQGCEGFCLPKDSQAVELR